MTDQSDTRDRVIRQGEQIDQLTKKVDGMSEQLTELVTAIQRARGAWLTILSLASVFGFIVGKFDAIRAWWVGH